MSSPNRYSHHALRALSHAARLASRYRHPQSDTGHLMVGVILTEGSIGSQVMRELDLNAETAEVYLKRLARPTETPLEEIPNAPSLDMALAMAADESLWLGHHYIGTEHLLLGITRVNAGNAMDLLRYVDISGEQIRRRVRAALTAGHTEFSLETARRNARLSELSRRVLFAAEQLALSLDHPNIGVGHLLMSLYQEKRGITSAILRQSGLDEARLYAAIKRRETTFLISVEVVIQAAVDQAEKMGSHYIGSDHLLLALALIPSGAALLATFGAEPEKVKRLLSKHLRRD